MKTPAESGKDTGDPGTPADGSLDVAEPVDAEPPTVIVDDAVLEDETVEDETVDAEPVDDEPAAAEAAVEDDEATDEPAAEDEPVTDEPVTDEPVTEEPVDDEPADAAEPVGLGEPETGQASADDPSDLTILIPGGQDADLVAPDRTVFIRGGQFSLDRADERPDQAPAASTDDPDAVEAELEPTVMATQGRKPTALPDPPAAFWQAPSTTTDDAAGVTLVPPAEDLASSHRVASGAPDARPPSVGPGQQSVADPSRYLEPYPADSPDGNPDDGYSDDSSLSYPDGYPAADPEDEQVGLALGLTDHEALTERRNTIRRQRRQTWTFLAMFGSVLLLGVAGYTFWTGLWSIGDGTVTGAVACPVPTSTVAPIKGISLTVLNGTTRRGLAGDVARGLQARKFAIIATGNDNTTKPGKETAVIRHGPAGVLKAKTVAAQVAGKVLMVNDKREDESVDLILQPAFKQLNDVKTATRLTAPPPVASPDGCVPVA